MVNAACKVEDEAHLRANLSDVCDIELARPDRALIALQGPKAESALAKLCADAAGMRFMDAGPRRVGGFDCFVSRSGYTGEDGFEISVPADTCRDAGDRRCWRTATCCRSGLGARDSLRLEAGLCLYGHDIDTTTTPVEARWNGRCRRAAATAAPAPAVSRRGQDPLQLRERRAAPPRRPEGRKAARRCAKAPACLRTPLRREAIGKVTSGGFGPSLNAPVAMGYLPTSLAAIGTHCLR